MSTWPQDIIDRIAATDDFHVSVYHPDGKSTGTLTWIWSVVVDDRLFIRAWSGQNGKWYRAALEQGAGRITAGGGEYEVAYEPIDDPALLDAIDDAYRTKYAGSSYMPPMIAAGPRSATVEVLLKDQE